MTNDFVELDGLSEEEKKVALKILKEFSQKGSSSTYDNLISSEYNEIPVDIETFLTDDRYLGRAWKDMSGKSKVYPFWMEQMKNLFPNSTDTAYSILLETGARGIGKSEVACGICAPYIMYRMLCLKNPLEYFRLKQTDKICFAFMNIKKELAKRICIDKFQKAIQMSPWFMERGRMTTLDGNPFWVPPEPIEIIIGSQADDVIGQAVAFAFFDEISFIRNQDIDIQKEKAKNMIDTAIGGMFTRFVHNGKNPTLLCVASSKRSEQSFMEEYIKIIIDTEGSKALIVDKPVWEVKPKGTYSSEIFYVALGNKFLESVVVPRDDWNNLSFYRERGYTIIEVPIDFEEKFLQDIERNLCDFAGISSSTTNKFMSGQVISETINKEWKNPLPDVIEVGNAPDDHFQYKDFFKLDNVPQEMISRPLYIHLDMSKSGDMTGIAGVWIAGKKFTPNGDATKDLSFRLAFSTSIKAPKGRQISYEKNRNFIRWLKEIGFNIKAISTDTFQSVDTLQILVAEGYIGETISVDRVDDGICRPYQYLRGCIYEKRFFMYNSDRLFDELVSLERNNTNGKIDHPPNGHKDAADAVCGATFSASKHAEEYAYDYGENFNIMFEVNSQSEAKSIEDINKEFEKELQNTFHHLGNQPSIKNGDSVFMDFGLGKAQPLTGGKGIIIL